MRAKPLCSRHFWCRDTVSAKTLLVRLGKTSREAMTVLTSVHPFCKVIFKGLLKIDAMIVTFEKNLI